MSAQLSLHRVDDQVFAVAGDINTETAHSIQEHFVVVQSAEVGASVLPFQNGAAFGLGGDTLSVVDPTGADVGVEMFYGLLDHLNLFLFGDLVCFHVDELDDSVQIVHDLLSVFFVVIHDGSSF